MSRDHALSPLLRASARLSSIASFNSSSISSASGTSTPDASLCRAISADNSDILDERVFVMTGVTTRERGDDEPGEGETDFKGIFHAERGCSGLPDVPRLELDVEDRLELIAGKWSREDDDAVRVAIGLGCVFVPIASDLSGLMLVPASMGSGTNGGDTWTFSFEIGSETRGYWRPCKW